MLAFHHSILLLWQQLKSPRIFSLPRTSLFPRYSTFALLCPRPRPRSQPLRLSLPPLPQWHKATSLSRGSRGVKSKATLSLKDLPQGLLAGAPIISTRRDGDDGERGTENEPAYPTVIHQARMNMRRFEGCVLLTRVGGFYEV